MGKQPRERPDVLVVVADDRRQRLRRAAAQEPEVPARDLPPVDVVVALHPEQHPLDRPEPRIVHAVAEEPPDEWAGGRGDRRPRERRAEPSGSGSRGAASRTRGRCRSRARHHEEGAGRLPRAARPPRRGPAAAAGPGGTCHPSTSRGRSGRPRSPRPSPDPSSRCRGRRAVGRRAAARGAPRVDGGRPAGRSHRPRPGHGRRSARRSPRRPPLPPAGWRGRGSRWADTAAGRRQCRVQRWRHESGPAGGRVDRSMGRESTRSSRCREPGARPELRQESQGEPARIDVRLETRPRTRRATAVAVARGDEVGRSGQQLVVALPQPL